MDRRAFVLGAGALAISTPLKAAQMVLGPPTAIGIPKRAWVAHPEVVKQQCQLWCWAASASMIFASRGHKIDQKKIVQKVFGGLVCVAAGTSLTMAQVLSDTWTDDGSTAFQSRIVAAYDPANGVNAITNAFIVNEIINDRPLLYANTHHAMVVVAVDYYETPMGPNVQAVGVLDPWPGSPDFHPLPPIEMVPSQLGGQMTFLAAVNI